MSQEIAAVLRRAAELIDTPEKWCQGATALDAQDKEVGELAPYAVRWCAFGAILCSAVAGRLRVAAWPECTVALRRQIRDDSIGHWNDYPGRQHAEVLAALRAAAEAEERNG